MKESYVDWCKN